jgi:micrococcal nuclease
MYEYKAYVVSIYDADTIRADIDLGFGIWKMNESIRLLDIDAPEMRGEERPAGLIARDYLRDMMPVGTEFTMETVKDGTGKFGRYLATIYLETPDGVLNINQHLMDEGYAEPYPS